MPARLVQDVIAETTARLVFRMREAGRLAGWWKLPWSVVSWRLCRRYRVLTRDLGDPLPSLPLPEGIRWSPLGPADGGRILALYPLMRPQELARRWREGQTAEGGWVDRDLVHFRWTALGSDYPLPYLRAMLTLSSRELAFSFLFTHPAYRGRGIAAVSIVRGLERGRALGCTRAVTLVSPFNRASLRTFARGGFRAVGTAGYWQAGMRTIPFARGAVALSSGRSYRLIS